MSTECKKELTEMTRKMEYYKEMYEMRTSAYLKMDRLYETAKWTIHMLLDMPSNDLRKLRKKKPQ